MSTISKNAFIDLQLHTIHSDGKWQPEDLLDHLKNEGFGLAAITDHERPDIVPTLQEMAKEKDMPLLIAVEMITKWRGQYTDILCYGFDPTHQGLLQLGEDLLRRQQENIRMVYHKIAKQGFLDSENTERLEAILAKPCAAQQNAFYDYMEEGKEGREEPSAKLMIEAGYEMKANDPAAVVETVHDAGGVCIIAHPGRSDGFLTYDGATLDDFRAEVPVDGLEVYYPMHSDEQTAMFLEYAQKHDLLYSSGSDSHGPERQLPIKYRAEQSQSLLKRLGYSLE